MIKKLIPALGVVSAGVSSLIPIASCSGLNGFVNVIDYKPRIKPLKGETISKDEIEKLYLSSITEKNKIFNDDLFFSYSNGIKKLHDEYDSDFSKYSLKVYNLSVSENNILSYFLEAKIKCPVYVNVFQNVDISIKAEMTYHFDSFEYRRMYTVDENNYPMFELSIGGVDERSYNANIKGDFDVIYREDEPKPYRNWKFDGIALYASEDEDSSLAGLLLEDLLFAITAILGAPDDDGVVCVISPYLRNYTVSE